MPILISGGPIPTWCEMSYFEIVQLAPGQQHIFTRRDQKEKLLVGQGQCTIHYDGLTVVAQRKTNLDLTSAEGQFEVSDVGAATILIRVCGDWGQELGNSGLFELDASENPQDNGDPVDYAKATNFDSHYHDSDEYWILFKGSGVAVSEGKHYEIAPGTCVATGMGHHHDLPFIHEHLEGVYFETTLAGQKRLGHLWNHTHGLAQPKAERV
jgi:mannose-6-phosphate isomerase-like protein (cupin superfamily)